MTPSPIAPMILRSTGPSGALRVDRLFEERMGLDAEQLAVQPLLSWIHEDDRAAFSAALDSGDGDVVARHRTATGGWLPFRWRVQRESSGDLIALGLLDESGSADLAVADADDLPRTSQAANLHAMAQIVEQKNPGLRCSILLTDEQHESVTVGAGPSLPKAYNEAVEGLRIGPFVGSCGTAAWWNVPVVVEDIFADPLWKDLREAARIAGVRACWSQPITSTSGDVLGAMALYSDTPCAPTERQMDGLEIAARMVGLAIERDRLEQQLLQAAKMEALGVLAGGIAHDFNNMLAVVVGNAEQALEQLRRGEVPTDRLEEIVTAGVGATDLCSQMLAYAGRGVFASEVLEINALVTEIGSLLKVTLSKKSTLEYALHDSPLRVDADRGQLRQVILNLISNAADAIGDHAGRIVISTGVREAANDGSGASVWLRVSDTGAGMDPATQARIFDPFFTTKAAGRGLGLAAVRGIVDRQGGAIQIESREGQGTTIEVSLPRAFAADEPPEPPGVASRRAAGARVLLVDDDDQVRRIFEGILRSAGYEVICARDGQEALDLFRRQGDSIDVVLLDLSMPKLDGHEVFLELRRMRPDVRVVLVSGYSEHELNERFAGLGVAGVLKKPSRMQQILDAVAGALVCGTAR